MITTATATATATELSTEIFGRIDSLNDKLEDQILVSQNRWVDHLLDLYNFVEVPELRAVIEATLTDLRYRGSVEAAWVRDELEMLAAAVEIESAFDSTAALPV